MLVEAVQLLVDTCTFHKHQNWHHQTFLLAGETEKQQIKVYWHGDHIALSPRGAVSAGHSTGISVALCSKVCRALLWKWETFIHRAFLLVN